MPGINEIFPKFEAGKKVSASQLTRHADALTRLSKLSGQDGIENALGRFPRKPDDPGTKLRLAQVQGSVPPMCFGKVMPFVTQGDLFEMSAVGTPTGGYFTLDYFDGTYNEDGTEHYVRTENIAWNTGERNVQNLLSALAPLTDKVTCSCGPFPTNSIYIQFTGDLAGTRVRMLRANVAELTGGTSPNVVIGYAKAASTNTDDALTLLNMTGSSIDNPNLVHYGTIDQRVETVGGSRVPRVCNPIRGGFWTQPVNTDVHWSTDGSGDSAWTRIGIPGSYSYQVTFTVAQINGLSLGAELHSDELIIDALNIDTIAVIPGAHFTDDTATGVLPAFNTDANDSGHGRAWAQIESATLVDTATDRRGTQYSDSVSGNSLFMSPSGDSFGGSSVAHSYTTPPSFGPTPLASGHDIADASDDFLAAIAAGTIGIAIKIKAGALPSYGAEIADLIVTVRGADIVYRYNT